MLKKALIIGCCNDAVTKAQREPFADSHRDLRNTLALTIEQIKADTLAEIERTCLKHPSDILFLMPSWRETPEELEHSIRVMRESAPERKLIFMDPFAQASSNFFNVLPYVDAFLKRQHLKDVQQYHNQFIGGNAFTDFLAKRFQFDFSDWSVGSPIPRGYEHRIVAGWNLGTANRFRKALHQNLWSTLRRPRKDIDVFCRLSLGSQTKKEWYCDYRLAAVNALKPLERDYTVIATAGFIEASEFVPPRQYLQELKRSRIVFSPFGWGESCWRDFEAICYDCLLIKPSMEHIITEPNIFIKDQTYVAVEWDFSDLEEKCRYYLDHPDEMHRIVNNARQVYEEYFQQKKFVKKIENLVAA